MSTIWRSLLAAWLGGTSPQPISLDQAGLGFEDSAVSCESEPPADAWARRQSWAHSSAEAPVIARTRSSSAASPDAEPE
jgi:hypothetical protein